MLTGDSSSINQISERQTTSGSFMVIKLKRDKKFLDRDLILQWIILRHCAGSVLHILAICVELFEEPLLKNVENLLGLY